MSQYKRWVFKQFDAAHGWELWVTDGTSAGTSLLKDIAIGPTDSSPDFLVPLGNGKTLFTASDATGQSELWITDGTADGMVMVKEIRADAFGSNPANVTAIGGGKALFMADDGVHGFEPWITDGTEAGTVMLKDIWSGFSSWPTGFAPLGDGRVLFSADDAAHGSELWITDGTEAGTMLLLDIEPGAMSSSPLELTPLGNGKVVFRAYTAAEASELWISDGTAAGTVLVKDIFGGVGDSYPTEFVPLGDGRAIFLADEPGTSREVWVTDGTAAGTVLLQDIRPGADTSYPSNLVTIGTGRALFIAQDNSHGREVWVTDGTPVGTQLLKDIVAGPLGGAQYELAALGDGRAVFPAWDADHGSELWVTDGTEAGTVLLKDISAGGGGSGPTRMFSLSDGRVMFQATDLSIGLSHWITDGTVAGTVSVQDIPDRDGNGGSPSGMTALGDGRLVFSASDDPNGSEVWVTDGTTAGTTLVRDINPGYWNSNPQDFLSMDNGTVLFVAEYDSVGVELWRTDGTLAGTSLVQDIAPGILSSDPYGLTRLNGTQAVFAAWDGTNGDELWVTDGTSAGTVMIDLNPGPGDSWPDYFQPISGGRVLFQASNGADGVEPWVTNGTVAGTFQLADIEAGGGSSSAGDFTDAGNGRVVFSAYSSATGYELWSTNGTIAGTALEMDIVPGAGGSSPQKFATIGPGVVVFTAEDGVNGYELWKTAGDGTGASLVKDIEPGMFGSYPSSITALGDGTALFSASTSADGTELWITDGTLAGTVLLADINPGAGSSDPQHFHRMNDGRVLFSASDGSNGYELWITDGTGGGTAMVKDIAVGANSFPGSFANLPDGRVVFNAYTNEFSWELWVTDGTAAGTQLVRDIFDAYGYGTEFSAVNAPPTLIDSAATLGSVAEGTTNPTGTTVDALLGTNNVTDPDGAVDAMAITAFDTSLGTWQFRLNGAGPWLNVNSALVNSQTDELALLLGPTDSIRLLPFGDLHGTLSSAITFRAWDMSEGAPGDYRLVTPGNGGISTGSDTASLTVTPVNDAPTFAPVAGDGIVTLDVGVDDVIRSMVVQPDGRILVAGDSGDTTTSDLLIARFLPDGSPDPAWGGTGVVLADPSGGLYDTVGQVVLQPDGKVLVSGTIEGTTTGLDFGVLRFNSDGTPDLTFGTGGVTTVNFNGTSLDQVNALVLQPDGKVVLAGFTDAVSVYDFALARLDANGNLDPSFGTGGIVMTDFGGGSYEIGNTVALQSDGKLVVGGFRVGASRDFALARYNTDGSLDPTFGPGGMVVTDFIGGSYDEIARLAIRPDGTIVVVGLTLPNTPGASYSFATTAYNPDGTLAEPLWHIDYGGADSAGLDLAVQPDGKIVVVGGTNFAGTDDMALFRLNDDLTLSTETGGILNGIPIDIDGHVDVAFAAALQTDGKILAAGFTGDGIERNLSLVRLLGSGVMDNHFGGSATDTLGNVVAFTEDQPDVVLNDAVRVVDPDLAARNGGAGNYAGASVTLSRQGGPNSDDVFSFDTTGAPFNLSGNSLRSGADTFATFTSGSGAISITFDSSAAIATQALVNAVLSRIQYANTSDAPPAQVTIAWSFSDGNSAAAQGPGGDLTAGGTTTVNITPANDPPVLSVPQADQNAAVYSAFSYIVPGNTFTDPDLDTLSYSATGLPAWLSFNPTTRTFSGTPGVGNVGFVDVTVTATDPSLASTSDVFRITVAPAAARVYIEGTDNGGGNRTLTANTAFLGAAPTGYQWYKNAVAIIGANGPTYTPVAASENFSLYTVNVSHGITSTLSGAVDPQAATPPAGILQSTGNPGNDTLPAAPIRAQTFIGYHGLDTITGTNGADWIDGGPDVDSMVGGLGNDTYIAHDALDVIVEAVGGGTDLVMSYVTVTLPAEVENLTLVGSNAFDGTGNSLANTLTGNGVANTMAGMAGNDSVNAGGGNDSVDGGADNDTLNGGDGADTLLGGTGNDSLIGAAGSDSLDGGDNDDKLDGGAAADVLLGGNGNDSLIGGGGNDMLTGGAGTDTLNGGAGADTFVLDNTSVDVIQSFAVVDDAFRLSKSLFPALNLGTLNGAAFWSGTGAHDPDDRIIYNPGTGALWYDADGNGAGAAVQIATLTGLAGALTQADFVVVA